MCNFEIDMKIFFGCDKNEILCTKICNVLAGDLSVLGGAKSIISQLSLNWAWWTEIKTPQFWTPFFWSILNPLQHMVVKCIVFVCVLYWFLGRSFYVYLKGSGSPSIARGTQTTHTVRPISTRSFSSIWPIYYAPWSVSSIRGSKLFLPFTALAQMLMESPIVQEFFVILKLWNLTLSCRMWP